MIYVVFLAVEEGYTFGEWTKPENLYETIRTNLKPGVVLTEIHNPKEE